MATVVKTLQINWTWGVPQGGDLSSIKGFKVAIAPEGANPNTNSVLTAIAGPEDRAYVFNNVVLKEATYTAWVQALYLGKDSSWQSSGNITIVDDGSATISNDSLTQQNLLDGAGWAVLPTSGADVTGDNTAYDTARVNNVSSVTIQQNAQGAYAAVTDMEADGIFSVAEKITWRTNWAGMQENYAQIIAKATAYGIQGQTEFTEFTTARDDLYNFLNVTHNIWAATPAASNITGTEMSDKTGAFYNKMQLANTRLLIFDSSFQNSNFELGNQYWSTSYNGMPVPQTTVGTVVNTGLWGGKALSIPGTGWFYAMQPIPVNTSKVYKGRFRVRQTVAPTDPAKAVIYCGVATLDKDYQNITGGSGTHRYFVIASRNLTVAEGWVEFEGTITGEGDAHTNFRAGTAYVRPMFIVNYNGGNGTVEVDACEFYEDIPKTNGIEDGATVGATWDYGSGNITGRPTDPELLNYIIPQGVFNGVPLPYAGQHVYIPCTVVTYGTAGWYKIFEATCTEAHASIQFHGTVLWGQQGGRYTNKAEVIMSLAVGNPATTKLHDHMHYAGDNPTDKTLANCRLKAVHYQNGSSQWHLAVYADMGTWREMHIDGSWMVSKSSQVATSWIDDEQVATPIVSDPTGTWVEVELVQEYEVGADSTFNAINIPDQFDIPTGTVNVGSAGSIKSDNYVSGSAGWAVDGAGNAEFNDVVVRGTVTGTNIIASDMRSQDDLFLIDTVNKIFSMSTNANETIANKVALTPGELTFYYGGNSFKSVKRIEHGFQTPGQAVTFNPTFQSAPQVLVSAYELQTYDASFPTYDHKLALSRGTVSTTGFTPTATLKISNGTNVNLTTGLIQWQAIEGGGGDSGCPCNCNYACTCNCAYACVCNCNYSCVCNCAYACTCNCNYACVCNCAYSDEELKENVEFI